MSQKTHECERLLQKKIHWAIRTLAEVYVINSPQTDVRIVTETVWKDVEGAADQARAVAPKTHDDFIAEFVKRVIRRANQLLNDGTQV